MKVLLVGNGSEKSIWRMVLEYFAVESHAANSGREALDLIHAGENFDLILVDRYMPIMNGLEVKNPSPSIFIKSSEFDSYSQWMLFEMHL